MILMRQNTAMRVYEARIKRYRVLCSKHIAARSCLVITSCWFATSRLRVPASVRRVYCCMIFLSIQPHLAGNPPHSATYWTKNWGFVAHNSLFKNHKPCTYVNVFLMSNELHFCDFEKSNLLAISAIFALDSIETVECTVLRIHSIVHFSIRNGLIKNNAVKSLI